MTVLELAPPFLAALLGAVVGAVFGDFMGMNIFLPTLIGAYTAVLPFIVYALRVIIASRRNETQAPPPPPEPSRPTENVYVQVVFIYLFFATFAALPVLVFLSPLWCLLPLKGSK